MKRLTVLTVVGNIDNAVSRAEADNNQEKADLLQGLRNSLMNVIHRQECVYWDELVQECRPIVAKDTLSLLEMLGESIKEP